MPKVLISDKMDPRAAQIFRERGVEVDEITGKTKEEVHNDTERDRILSAPEALTYGLADRLMSRRGPSGPAPVGSSGSHGPSHGGPSPAPAAGGAAGAAGAAGGR